LVSAIEAPTTLARALHAEDGVRAPVPTGGAWPLHWQRVAQRDYFDRQGAFIIRAGAVRPVPFERQFQGSADQRFNPDGRCKGRDDIV